MRSLKSLTLSILILSTFVVGYLFSRAYLVQHSAQSVPFSQRDAYDYPSPPLLRTLFLNYDSFASSLHWVEALIYFGDWRYTKTSSKPAHLLSYATTISELDPRFYNVYDWFNATYIASRLPEVSYQNLQTVENFMQQGMRRFPTYFELPYTTGLLSLGYSEHRTDAQRLDEYERGIHYLQMCTRLQGCPDTVPFTIAYLYKRKAELEEGMNEGDGASSSQQELLEFYKTLYAQTTSTRLQQQLSRSMLGMGMSRPEIDALESGRIRQFKQRYESTRSYLPLDLWTQIVYPGADASQLLFEPPPLRNEHR